jgi:hypothetical protein
MTINTVFENEKYVYNKKSATGRWVNELVFYVGDLTDVDLKSDWRFKEVKDKRKQLKLLGTKENLVLPIVYPLVLDDGRVINDEYHLKYDEEKE